MKKFLAGISVLMLLHGFALGQNYYEDAVDCEGDIFAGTHRAYVKTHKAVGPLYRFETLEDLFASDLLLEDEEMLDLEPRITRHADSERAPEEEGNVQIELAYIYGIYREPDNDYHIVLGNGETEEDKMWLLNVEVSGLPGDEDNAALERVRMQVEAYFGEMKCKSKKFAPLEYMVPVKIKGSLFFDVDHKAGTVGFGQFKPATAWELHPVTYIKFLD